MKNELQYIMVFIIVLSLITSISGINAKYHHCNMMNKTDLVLSITTNDYASVSCPMEEIKTPVCNMDDETNNNSPIYTYHCCNNQDLMIKANFDLINHSESISVNPQNNPIYQINIHILSLSNNKSNKETITEIVHKKYGPLFLHFISQMRA